MAKQEKQGWLLILLLLYIHALGLGGSNNAVAAAQGTLAAEDAECALRELRCELLCQYAEMQIQCDACRSRRPLRFGKRDHLLATNLGSTSGYATKSSSDRLAVTVTTSREARKSLPLAKIQLLLSERRNHYAKEQPCYCCNPSSLACLLSLS